MGEPNASTCWVCGGKFGADDVRNWAWHDDELCEFPVHPDCQGEAKGRPCCACGKEISGWRVVAEAEEESSEADSSEADPSDEEESSDEEGLVWPASTPGDPSVCILCAEPLGPPRGMVVHRGGRCGYAAHWRCIEAVAHALPTVCGCLAGAAREYYPEPWWRAHPPLDPPGEPVCNMCGQAAGFAESARVMEAAHIGHHVYHTCGYRAHAWCLGRYPEAECQCGRGRPDEYYPAGTRPGFQQFGAWARSSGLIGADGTEHGLADSDGPAGSED